ncbi:MAG TPA: LysM peptidoglycan-binding domain-containing protein [Anaerolineaceae bacterium]|nr:LysM peptidoglycan-binding domain-containing protein [Anaerolineaceae bacterium]
MKTRSVTRLIQVGAAWVVLLSSMLACSQGYVSPAELTATAVTRGMVETTAAPAEVLPTSTAIQPTDTATQPPLPTFTDLPRFTSTPQPSRTPDPNATPKPPIQYYTQAGDTLVSISGRFGVSADQVISNETIPTDGLINPGILLIIPDVLEGVYDSLALLPDSEVVYSPSAVGFDIITYVAEADGYLNGYQETVGSRQYTGAELVQRVALENSINPYLLLTLLEYKSHWVTGRPTNMAESEYPMGYVRLEYRGLYKQLSWAVQQLSIGYYGWRAGILNSLTFKDGSSVRISPGLNAGTAAIHYLFSRWYNQAEWADALYGSNNMPDLMSRMFGDLWERSSAVDPLYPADLQQPDFLLPFIPGRVWSFTGGPHSAWGEDGALAALDFAPPSSATGCVVSNEWITAVAPGVIVRSGEGIVIQDLDGDGIEQTGWNIMYLHVETRDRAAVGTIVDTGDKIGHPSCEGGVSTGTHVHVVRKFNGEWILADGPLPFNLSGYLAKNGDAPYEGSLVREDARIIANPLGTLRTFISIP